MRGMQTDNSVFIRLSTLSPLKEEIILFGPRDRCILKIDSRGVSFASKFPCSSQNIVLHEILIYLGSSNPNRLEGNYTDRKEQIIESQSTFRSRYLNIQHFMNTDLDF